MSSDNHTETGNNLVASKTDEGENDSYKLASKEEKMEAMTPNQNEDETTSRSTYDKNMVSAEPQNGTACDATTSNFAEHEKSQFEITSSIGNPEQEIAMSPAEPLNSKEESNDQKLDLNDEENEAPPIISKEGSTEPSLGTEGTLTTERKAGEQTQETKGFDSGIDLNEPLDIEQEMNNNIRDSNGSNIEIKCDAVEDDEKVCPDEQVDRKTNVSSTLDENRRTENISKDETLCSSELPHKETEAVMTTSDKVISIDSESSLRKTSQSDNQSHSIDEQATGPSLTETLEEKGARKVPPVPAQISNGTNNKSSEKEPYNIPTSTSPPLPSRQTVETSTSPRLPPRGRQREEPSKTKNAVPPSLEEEMKSEKFRRNFEETKRSSHHHVPLIDSKTTQLDSTAEINLIASRYRKTSHHLNREGEETRESLQEGQSFLKSTYTSFLENLPEYNEVEDVNEEDREMFKIDWSFWTQVVNDFATVASNEPEKLEAHVTDGIPPQIRGIMWQLMANSKSREMEDIYETLLDTECLHEATIRRDLRRTKFVAENKMESLFKIIKVYSVYDPDVGYTQGMGFIAAPLLINCDNEAETFGLMVGLMKNYGLRELFLPGMPGLMLMLYQFDRLLEEHSPTLYNRLIREGISSTMYATQWFLTFFAYKFPLEFVLRIFDIVFVEGIEVLLKFAVNLMLKNEETLVKLRFDELLEFLKDELFNYYLMTGPDNTPVVQTELSRKDSYKGDEDSTLSYNVDLFVHDAMTGVYITPLTLRRYKGEYIEIHEKEQKKQDHYESLRIQNHQLQREAQKLEHDYSVLNYENISAANELIQNRLNMEMLLDEKNDLINTMTYINNQIQEEIRKQDLPNPDASLPKADLREDLERTISRNNEVMRENGQLEEKITELLAEIDELIGINKEQVSTASLLEEDSKGKRRKGWTSFKKVFK